MSAVAEPPGEASTLHTPRKPTFDPAGVAAHGIGRGDFAALVFSGSRAALGDVAGHHTWNTARKFVLPDPRLTADDVAGSACPALPRWTAGFAPQPGVCFVFDDDSHPGVAMLACRGGAEWTDYVVLSRLTPRALAIRRLGRVLARAGPAPVALLGFGDQGEKLARLAIQSGFAPGRIAAADDRPARREVARSLGLSTVNFDDPRLAGLRPTDGGFGAIISSPLARPERFSAIIAASRSAGLPVFDNARPWDDAAELEPCEGTRGRVWATGAAHRALTIGAAGVRAPGWAEHGLRLRAIRHDRRHVGDRIMPHLWTTTIDAAPDRDSDLAQAAGSPLAHLSDGCDRVWLGIEGQSNHHDAAQSIFAAREFLRAFAAAAVRIIPSESRAELGATRFEHVLARTTTGRCLGSPFMTAVEQTAIGVLAAEHAAESPIVEIGSALGGSTLLMAAATHGSREPIWSIDPDAPTRGAMRLLFEHEGYAARLRQVVETSDAAIGALGHLQSRAGLVFIDGLHTEEAVAADFSNYAPLVRPGGCIAFHDADSRFAGIFRLLAERVATDRRFAPLFIADTLAAFGRVRS